MKVEFTSKEPGRLMTEIPNNSFPTVTYEEPAHPKVAAVQHAPLKTGLRGQ
jgi:hypothetical protein